MVLWSYVQEHPKAQPVAVLIFKASQKMGPRLKVSSDSLGEAGNLTCDPWKPYMYRKQYENEDGGPTICNIY